MKKSVEFKLSVQYLYVIATLSKATVVNCQTSKMVFHTTTVFFSLPNSKQHQLNYVSILSVSYKNGVKTILHTNIK